MSEYNITVNSNSSIRLKTAGKYCDRDIVVTSLSDENDIKSILEKTIVEYSDPTITTIKDYSFYACNKLQSISCPSVKTIGNYAFNGCSSLKSLNFPLVENITTAGFRACSSLTSVDFPLLKEINSYSFYQTNLHTLIIRNINEVCTLINTNAFSSSAIDNGEGYIYVPKDLIDAYKSATNWSIYADQIRAIEDYPEICGG